MKKILFYMTLLFVSVNSWSQITITESAGWLESAFVKWTNVAGADSYNVYYTGGGQTDKKIDNQLIRNYGSYFRADVLGLAAGNYTLKIVPVISGSENTSASATTSSLTVTSHTREGFAFSDNIIPGGYNEDGTPKTGAQIIYVTLSTLNTVSCNVITGSNGTPVPTTGLMNIIAGRNKGYDKTPLIIRMIGQIKKSQITGLYGGTGDFIAFIGANATDRRVENITFEGVGDDATTSGYGFLTRRSKGIEIRNLGIMLFGDDGVSMEGDNSNIWVHNCDFMYGAIGGDSDQIKGDGSIDMKYNTTNITISFNHFWDSGKTTFAGGETEVNPIYFTYHHNWFDHSDSRHPRLCHATVHVYNNYYDANASMGLLNTENTSAFVEANYYRNTPYPMMINMQGSNYEIWPDGTQNGGINKAFNNKMVGTYKTIYQTERATDFDAYLVTSRNEQIPNTVISRTGGNTYSNFDTAPTMYSYTPDAPDDVPGIVSTYAGRVKGGDFKWTFNNSTDDGSKVLNTALKDAINAYQSALVNVQGEAPIPAHTLTSTNNNSQTVASGNALNPIVFTWGGGATDAAVTGLPASGISFVKDLTAKTITITGTPTANVSYSITTSGNISDSVTASGNIIVAGADQIHNFTLSGKTSTFYSISGNMNSAAGSASYNSLALTARLKIESSTTITYTTTEISSLTLVFDTDYIKRIKLDGVNYTVPAGGIITIPSIPAGNHSITRGDSTNLYYIKTSYPTLGLEDNVQTPTLTLYPNPATNVLYISSSDQKIENIAIYSLSGALLKNISNVSEFIDISNLTTGSYLIKLTTHLGTFTQKIIKK